MPGRAKLIPYQTDCLCHLSTELGRPEIDERLSRREVEKWLDDSLNRQVVDVLLLSADVAGIHQALEEKDDYVIVAAKSGFGSALALDDFSLSITHKALGVLVEEAIVDVGLEVPIRIWCYGNCASISSTASSFARGSKSRGSSVMPVIFASKVFPARCNSS